MGGRGNTGKDIAVGAGWLAGRLAAWLAGHPVEAY